MRIEGSQGRPEREFNGPVVGLQERYRDGLAALGDDFAAGRRAASSAAACAPTRTSASSCGSTAARACTARPSTGATATRVGWDYIDYEGDVQPRGYSDAEVSQP